MTTYTGPALTPGQMEALASIDARGDVLRVHPARVDALVARRLVEVDRDDRSDAPRAELTDLGRSVLAEASACSCAEQTTLHSGHCCMRDYPPAPYDGPLTCGHDADFRARAACAQEATR